MRRVAILTTRVCAFLTLAACGTFGPEAAKLEVVDGSLGYVEGQPREYYFCSKRVDRPGLGEFALSKGLTLDGAPYSTVNSGSYLSARWNTRTRRGPTANSRTQDHDYAASWYNEAAATTSTAVDLVLSLRFPKPHAATYRVRITRPDGTPPQRTVSHGFWGPMNEGSSMHYGPNNSVTAVSWLMFPLSDLLMLAGDEQTLIATEHDAAGFARQSIQLDIQTLRDGVEVVRELMAEFEAETKDYTRSCSREYDEKIYVNDYRVRVDGPAPGE